MRTVLRTPWPVAQEMLEYIATRDHRLMRRVNRWSAPRWVRLWMVCATRGGDGWLWYALGLLVFLFGGGEGLRALAAMAVATGAGIVLFLWLKRLTGRRRPCQVAPTAGPRSCRPINSRSRPATPSLPSPSPFPPDCFYPV